MKKFIAMISTLLITGTVLAHPDHGAMVYANVFEWVGHYLGSRYHLVVMAMAMLVLMALAWGLRDRSRMLSTVMGVGGLGTMAGMIWTLT